jgi:hypothetical protein
MLQDDEKTEFVLSINSWITGLLSIIFPNFIFIAFITLIAIPSKVSENPLYLVIYLLYFIYLTWLFFLIRKGTFVYKLDKKGLTYSCFIKNEKAIYTIPWSCIKDVYSMRLTVPSADTAPMHGAYICVGKIKPPKPIHGRIMEQEGELGICFYGAAANKNVFEQVIVIKKYQFHFSRKI